MQEQRQHRRSSTEMNIRIFQNGYLQNLAKSQNLTSDGMFIQTDALLFSKGTLLDVVFEDMNHSICYKVEARVVHRSLKGIGVEFLNHNGHTNIYKYINLDEQPKVVA